MYKPHVNKITFNGYKKSISGIKCPQTIAPVDVCRAFACGLSFTVVLGEWGTGMLAIM
jgi:hypothetical protein